MNTKQLIIIWNGCFILCLVILTILVLENISGLLVSLASVLFLIIGIVLLYLTYGSSKEIERKRVLKKGILPIPIFIVCTLIIVGIISYVASENSIFKENLKNKIMVYDPAYGIVHSGNGIEKTIFSGRIKNNSNESINRVKIRIRIYKYNYNQYHFENEETNSFEEFLKATPWGGISNYSDSLSKGYLKFVGKQIDTESLEGNSLNIPANETKSIKIENEFSEINPSNYWVWDFEVIYAN